MENLRGIIGALLTSTRLPAVCRQTRSLVTGSPTEFCWAATLQQTGDQDVTDSAILITTLNRKNSSP